MAVGYEDGKIFLLDKDRTKNVELPLPSKVCRCLAPRRLRLASRNAALTTCIASLFFRSQTGKGLRVATNRDSAANPVCVVHHPGQVQPLGGGAGCFCSAARVSPSQNSLPSLPLPPSPSHCAFLQLMPRLSASALALPHTA